MGIGNVIWIKMLEYSEVVLFLSGKGAIFLVFTSGS
jgi:hypothetical protein